MVLNYGSAAVSLAESAYNQFVTTGTPILAQQAQHGTHTAHNAHEAYGALPVARAFYAPNAREFVRTHKCISTSARARTLAASAEAHGTRLRLCA